MRTKISEVSYNCLSSQLKYLIKKVDLVFLESWMEDQVEEASVSLKFHGTKRGFRSLEVSWCCSIIGKPASVS